MLEEQLRALHAAYNQIYAQAVVEKDTKVIAALVVTALLLLLGLLYAVILPIFSSSDVVAKAAVELKEYSEEEVAAHCTREDLWLIVKKPEDERRRVYDLTEYVDEHVGGLAILNNPGKDNTDKFFGPQHPPSVFVLIEQFHIGWVKEASKD